MSLTRRSFLGTTAMGAFGTTGFNIGTAFSAESKTKASEKLLRSNPMDGIKRENIKITGIKITPLSYAKNDGWLWRCGGLLVWKADAALCEIFTDKGIVGIAEGSPYAGPDKIKDYTDKYITPYLIGKNPFDCEFFSTGGVKRNFVSTAAWAGINNACWDIIGKAAGKPVYKLLADGIKPDGKINIYASGGVSHAWYENGEQELIDEALRYKKLGYDTFKFRNGTNWKYSGMTADKYVKVLENLRAAVGPDYKLCLEKFPWTYDEIIGTICPAIEALKFYWFEEPWDPNDKDTIEKHLAINKSMPSVMVSGGETQYVANDCHEFLRTGAWDIIQTDCNLTGINENWKIARLANIYGRYMSTHNWVGGLTTIANAHLIAAVPNGHMCELNQTFNPLKWEIFKEPYPVVNGIMTLPDKPGYGVEMIDDVEKKFPFVPGNYYKANPKYEGLNLPIWWG